MKKMLLIPVLLLSTFVYSRRTTGDDLPALGTSPEAWAEEEVILLITKDGLQKPPVQKPVPSTAVMR